MEKFLSLIMNDSGEEFIFINFQKKLTGLIDDLFLYLVQILIWYVSPSLIFFENKLNIFLYFL